MLRLGLLARALPAATLRDRTDESTDDHGGTLHMNKDETLRQIAAKHLNVETLDTRNSDSIDFHEVAVWSLRSALEAAYDAGASAKEAEPPASQPTEGSGHWHEFTVAEAVEHLKAWIDEIDDPTRIAMLFDPICGCSRMVVINGTIIRVELP